MNSSWYSHIGITLPTGRDHVITRIYGSSDEYTEPEETEDVDFRVFEQAVQELAFSLNLDSEFSVKTVTVIHLPLRLDFLLKIFVCLSVCLPFPFSSYKYFHYLSVS